MSSEPMREGSIPGADQLIAKWRAGSAAMTAEADEENTRRYLRDEHRITYCRAKALLWRSCADELEALVRSSLSACELKEKEDEEDLTRVHRQ